ncbi:MAG TPA: 7-carboxy-7-deazaguanine synthase QueE [Opitutales bacterium]|nr:7-carboxy-7-deazaguanine synthase QueE [Opitutales bacterium]
MFITEIFQSIQGEGMLTGVPSIFVRTGGCNLRCNWCDTPYASWSPEGSEMTLDEIEAKVKSLPGRHVVLTGGEPMIARNIRDLAVRFRKSGYHITIETAGTIGPDEIDCDLASISPKLSNSTPDERFSEAWRNRHEATRLQPDVLRNWIDHYPYQLKFVVSELKDLEEIESLIDELDRPIPRDQILLMPEGIDKKSLDKRSRWLVDLCREKGYRYCPRLHISLFGNRRGT